MKKKSYIKQAKNRGTKSIPEHFHSFMHCNCCLMYVCIWLGLAKYSTVSLHFTSLHLSHSLFDRWGTKDDRATTVLHSSLFSAFRRVSPNFNPVHSLMLSSHLFFCLPLLLPPCPVPCRIFAFRQTQKRNKNQFSNVLFIHALCDCGLMSSPQNTAVHIPPALTLSLKSSLRCGHEGLDVPSLPDAVTEVFSKMWSWRIGCALPPRRCHWSLL